VGISYGKFLRVKIRGDEIRQASELKSHWKLSSAVMPVSLKLQSDAVKTSTITI
jgi:hypothetical protein